MDAAVLLSFAAASLVLAAAPGPDILYVLAQSAQSGARAGLAVVVGLMIGCLIQTAAAAAGLAVVAASPWLFLTIRLAGAAYLVYLAWGAWHAPVSVGQTQAERINLAVLLRRGVIMNVTNPKVQIFFLAFFPQFASKGATGWQMASEMGLLGVVFTLCAFVVMAGCALFAGVLSDTIRSPRVQFVLNKASALIFLGLAVAAVVAQ
jgi:threonine/homoserine/homoserine lactone efflux protein